jgi:HemK-like putative methylase
MTKDEQWLLEEKYGGEKTAEFLADCERLAAGEPVAYLIGYVPFLGATIYLDSQPLIPRPETEYWVEKAISDINSQFRGLTPESNVLDLCAGSGCIGVAILKAIPFAQVDFIERDERHHMTIRKNLNANRIDHSRVRVLGGDLFEVAAVPYDFILANPPYIDASLERTDPNVLAHEPHDALFASDHGFALIERIILEAPRHLARGGILYIEHEPEHAPRIRETAGSAGFDVATQPDQYGVLRYSRLASLV